MESPKPAKKKRCRNACRQIMKILGCVIFGGFIYENIPKNQKSAKSTISFTGTATRSNQFTEGNACYVSSCNIVCIGGNLEDVSNTLQKATSSDAVCSSGYNLTIYNTTFPNSTLQENWLAGDYNIIKLYLLDVNLTEVEAKAFENSVFKYLTDLEISKANISNLPNGVFSKLQYLGSLKLDASVRNFSSEYLQGVAPYIIHLDIHGMSTETSPKALFGSLPLEGLKSLDLRYNNFGDKIASDSFENVKATSILLLASCNISNLPVGVFDSFADGLQYLDLRNNNLTTVSGDIFEPLISLYKYVQIGLGGNRWNCSPRLISLAKLMEEFPLVFEDQLYCASPLELEGIPLNSNILSNFLNTTGTEGKMNRTTSRSTSATDAFHESTTAANMKPNAALTEVVCGTNENNGHETGNSNEVGSVLTIEDAVAKFNISKVSVNSVEIIIDGNSEDLTLLWFSGASNNEGNMENHYKDYSSECAELGTHRYIISDLELGVLYTICVIRNDDSEVPPMSCQSYFVEIECVGDDWISQLPGTTIMATCGIGIAAAMLLGAVVMFCVVRCCPTLLEGCDRIVVLDKNIKERKDKDPTKRWKIAKKCRSVPSTYEVIPCRTFTAIRKDSMYFKRIPEHSPPPLPKRSSVGIASEFPAEGNKLSLVTDLDDGYFVPCSRA
ncbi:unnamed protein product [Hermetia illucens]|uniref:Uncharacterized protein n=1 Tax=Hermetia illucens TaxID=343691 RepID=A0A7R8YLR6_HERIL|nr:uncharacterized protein LOC119661556 [Hermetia illucens]CAD7077428.1 unnamed protein product [Hermetia illucens]